MKNLDLTTRIYHELKATPATFHELQKRLSEPWDTGKIGKILISSLAFEKLEGQWTVKPCARRLGIEVHNRLCIWCGVTKDIGRWRGHEVYELLRDPNTKTHLGQLVLKRASGPSFRNRRAIQEECRALNQSPKCPECSHIAKSIRGLRNHLERRIACRGLSVRQKVFNVLRDHQPLSSRDILTMIGDKCVELDKVNAILKQESMFQQVPTGWILHGTDTIFVAIKPFGAVVSPVPGIKGRLAV
ncbi:hypothetical protein EDB81DRAFT_763836 [Dactylonectria macrodidyma]|uniref:Uncharacterized protein n=1 Tax=Dactylonectria macrodidyma TaxID=307937 RepID=A0A9P9E5B0_9HYPO|nr:hypothetical protein EDB81DRAFT_763836 [Dactylonectria macrodidyma]